MELIILSKKSTYILELKLDTEKYQEDILNKRLEIGRQIYNATLGEVLKRYNHLKIQRDLYSAFLIMNSKKNLESTARNKYTETFDRFLELHNKEIEKIKKVEGSRIFSNFGIKKIS